MAGGSGAGTRGVRTRVGGALVLGVLALVAGPVSSVDAQGSAPESGEIRNGTAKATALVSRIGPGVGDLELAMRGGVAVTQVRNDLGQATSQTLDMGLIGSSLTAQNCRGEQYVRPDDLPQPTFVDNRDGDVSADRDESGTTGSPFGIGRMSVRASDDPVSAVAVTTTGGFALAPAIRVGSGRAEATTEVLPGEGRQAIAEVVSSLDLGGVVTMEGMRWRAFHRTGTDPAAEAGFDVGRSSVGGTEFPSTDMAAFEEAANAALAPLGAAIRFPRVERLVEPTDLVRVRALRLEIRDSPAGRTVFGPLLDATRGQRGDLFDALVEIACDTSSFLLVGDVVLSVVSGTGFLTLELGGAEASSADFELGDPFGAPIVPPADGTPPPPATAGLTATGPFGPTAAPPASPPPPVPAEQALPASSRSGPLDRFCESVHPNGGSCRDGTAVAVGLLALLGAAGLAGADLFRQRRAGAGSNR